MSRRRLRIGPALLLAFAASAVGVPAGAQTAADASPAGAGPTVNAVWTEHEFTFTYFGRGTYYSCGGLDSKIAYILTELGARPEPWVRVSCVDGTGVQRMPTARIKVAVPTEVTPELLAQFEAEKSKRELIAKTQGQGTAVDVTTAQFPAGRRIVEFTGGALVASKTATANSSSNCCRGTGAAGNSRGTRFVADVHAARVAVRFGPAQA